MKRAADYDQLIDLAAKAMLVAGGKPELADQELAAQMHYYMLQAIAFRGGVTTDGRYLVEGVMKDVISEVVERAMRQLRNELVPRLRAFMDEDSIEKLERELSASLAHVLEA